jgi:hypothetical protein
MNSEEKWKNRSRNELLTTYSVVLAAQFMARLPI